jgi:hypothetical protein
MRHKENAAIATLLPQTGWWLRRDFLNHHPVRSKKELRDVFLMSRPPLLARRGDRYIH